ncbi:MAG: hypothetical protein IBJ10_11580 [Phycisphaerales bacterium]|nr:hypothetical protein [Phycisphaerales bacterium]
MADLPKANPASSATEACRAVCPRCAYDLEGARAAWTDACPVSGVCSECGYAFPWADLLRADRQRVRWLYEHAPRWWRIDQALATLLVALVPSIFWRKTPLHARLRPARLALWTPLVIGACLLASLTFTTAFFFLLKTQYGTWPGRNNQPILMSSAWTSFSDTLLLQRTVFPNGRVAWTTTERATMQFGLLLFNLAALAVCLTGASHWSGARIRRLHFVRVAAFAMAPALVIELVALTEFAWRHIPTAFWIARRHAYGGTISFPVGPPQWLMAWMRSPRLVVDDLLAWAWLLAWWWTALKSGIGIRDAQTMWFAAMVAGTLGMLVASAYGLILWLFSL